MEPSLSSLQAGAEQTMFPPVQTASLCQLTCSSFTAPVLAFAILKGLSFIVGGRKRNDFLYSCSICQQKLG